MAWTIEFLSDALKDLKALDRTVAARIVKTFELRIATLDDPRTTAAALAGTHKGYWRWRVGDYRIVGQINDSRITILVIRVAHPREVYR